MFRNSQIGIIQSIIVIIIIMIIIPLNTPSPGEVFIFYRHIARVTQKVTKSFVFFERFSLFYVFFGRGSCHSAGAFPWPSA